MRIAATIMAAMAMLVSAGPTRASPVGNAPCDRMCLEAMVDTYLQAMLAKKLNALPLAPDVRFAENYQVLQPGEGSWRTIDGLGTYRHIFADPQSGNVGFIGTVTEHGARGFMDLRLKVRDHRIVEIESFLMRDPGAYARYEKMAKPDAAWFETEAAGAKLDRAGLIRTVNKYFQSMQRNDGLGDYSFFHPDCNRLEHALQTTNLKTKEAYGHSTDTDFRSETCEQQWKTGFLGFVTVIRDRRYLIVDEERQAVFAFATFDHNGTVRQLFQTNGKTFVLPPWMNVPRTLQVNEAFKVRDGKLYRIEMTLIELPYGASPPWQDVP